MNKRDAHKLAHQIQRDAPTCRVTGFRHYVTGRDAGYYSLDVVDTVSGVPFEVASPEAWADRLEESRLYQP